MATPFRIKRSAVPGKRPVVADLQLGELALNTYDGNLFAQRDTGGVGIGTTVSLLTPWIENYGGQSIFYNQSVGIGTTNPTSKLHIVGNTLVTGVVTATSGFVGNLTGTATSTTNIPNLTGDITSDNLATTLAIVNSNTGQFGSQTSIPVVTVNAKGLVTAVTTAAVGTALTVSGDSGSVDIDLLSETLTISGGTNLTSSGSGNAVTVDLDPNISLTSVVASGIITATSFSGSGINLTGIVTSIVAGTNVTISGSTGQVTINSTASGGGGGSSQFVETSVGIHTLSSVGIGTTNPTSALTVTGNALVTGVVTATSFSGDGSALTGITASQTPSFTTLNVVGVSTFAGITTVTGTTLFAKQLNVSGVVTATSFSGDGSGLTSIPAGQLTGSLPALDGSALTGIVGSGSGVIIKNSGSLVGTAGTIDFGDNLTVSAISAGIVTVTGSASGSSQFVTTSVGIHTLSNVGIGTTNPSIELDVLGDVEVTGTITAAKVFGAYPLTFPIGDYDILGTTEVDAFGISLLGIFDCLKEPSGTLSIIDLEDIIPNYDYGTL